MAYFNMTITVDLRGITRNNATYDLVITLEGTGASAYCTLHKSVGLLVTDFADAEMAWYKKIWQSLTNGFTSVVDAIKGDGNMDAVEDMNGEISDSVGEMEQMGEIIGSVSRPDDFSPEIPMVDYVDASVGKMGFDYVMASPYILPLILVSMTLCFTSYALFGKR